MCGPRCVHLCGCAFCVHAFLCPALGVHVPMCFSLYARLCLSLHMCAQSYMCVPVWPQEVGPFGDGRNFLLPHLLPKQEDVCWLRNGLLQQGFTYWVAQEVLVTIGSAASLPQNSPSWSNHWEAGYSHIRKKQWQPQFTCLKKQCSPGPRLSKILVCRWSGIVRAIHFFSPPPVSRTGMSIIQGPAIFTWLC